MIKSSLEWSFKETELRHKAASLSNRSDLMKMISNIQPLIKELSKAELEVRRGKKSAADIILAKVNEDIEMIEEFIFVATLIG